MKMSKKLIALLMALVMVFALVACAPADDADENKDNDKVEDNKDNDKKEDNKQEDNKDEDAEYTVVFSINDQITTTDDFNNFSMANKHTRRLWGDALVEVAEDGSFINGLATEIVWAEGGLSCDITIHDKAVFSNGEKLTAEDVAFSYNRIAIGEGLMNTMVWYKLDRAEVTGDYSLTLYFTEPMPNFNSEATWVPIICKSACEADPENFWNAPVGSGIYKWIETDFVDGTATLERWNDEWWGYEAFGKEPGNVKYVKYLTINENTTRVSALRSGEVTICASVPGDSISILEGDGISVVKTERASNIFLSINTDSFPFLKDKNFREAMSLAIDRELIVESIMAGVGIVATFPVPPSVEGYVDGYEYEYNVEKAKDLVAQTSYAGEALQLDISPGVLMSTEIAQALEGMFAEVGIKMTINQMEGAAWNSARFGGEYCMQLCSFAMTAGSNFKIIYEIIGPVDKFCGNLENEAAMAKFEEAMVEMDYEKYCQLSGEGMALIFENYGPMIYIFDVIEVTGVDPDLQGLFIYPDSTMELRYLYY